MAQVWYSRRPEVAALAKKSTMARVEQFRRIADDLQHSPRVILEPQTGIPWWEVFLSVAHELELRLSGATFIDLAPADPCPDPTRLFAL